MGGRGSSSGVSEKGKTYGSEYTTVYQSGNIKFIKINEGNITPPFETMTKGRVYVTVSNQNKLKSVVYYDKHNKRHKQVDMDQILLFPSMALQMQQKKLQKPYLMSIQTRKDQILIAE